MSDPFETALAEKVKAQATSPFDEALGKKQKQDGYKYSVLPLSEDEQGKLRFDSNAGIVGAIKRAVTLPGDVATGKTDPMSDEGISRATELATMASPVNPAVRAGERAIPGAMKAMRPGETPAPTPEALYGASEAAYTKARGMGVDYDAPSVANLASTIRSDLEGKGVLAELAPKSFSILGKLEKFPPGAVAPYVGIEAARRSFGNAAKDFANPTEQLAAKHIIDQLDAFIAQPPAKGVVAGPAADLSKVATEARGNYAAAKRSDKLTGIEDAADLRAAVANSGANVDNTIRRHVASLLLNPKTRAGFSKDELSSLEEVARGTPSRNALRMVGNLLGGGGGLGAAVTSGLGAAAGGFTGGPVGAAVGGAASPIIGYLAKSMANKKTLAALQKADEKVRKRSPLFEQIQAETPDEVISPDGRALLMRAIGLSLMPQGGYERQP